MPKQDIPINDIAGAGVIIDTPPVSLPPNVFTDVRNVRFKDGAIRKMEGEVDLLTVDNNNGLSTHSGLGPMGDPNTLGRIVYLAWWGNPNIAPLGGYFLFAQEIIDPDTEVVQSHSLFIMDHRGDPTSVRELGSGYDREGRWQHTQFAGGFAVIFNNGIDKPQYILDPDGNTEITSVPMFADLPGWDSYEVNEILIRDTFTAADTHVFDIGRNVDFTAERLVVARTRGNDPVETLTRVTGDPVMLTTPVASGMAQGLNAGTFTNANPFPLVQGSTDRIMMNYNDSYHEFTNIEIVRDDVIVQTVNPTDLADWEFNADRTRLVPPTGFSFTAQAGDVIRATWSLEVPTTADQFRVYTDGSTSIISISNVLIGDLIQVNLQSTNPVVVRAGVIRAFGDFLVAGNLTERDETDTSIVIRNLSGVVRTSDAAAPGGIPNNWNPFAAGVSTADEFVVADTGVVQDMAELQGNLYIYTNSSIVAMRLTGNPQVPLVIQPVTTSYGCQSTGGLLEFDGQHIVIGSQDIYLFGGNPGNIQSLSDARVRRYFFENLNPIHEINVFMIRNQAQDEIWICYPTLQSTVGECDEALIWNYRDNTWTIRELNDVWSGDYASVHGGGRPERTITPGPDDYMSGNNGPLNVGRQEVQDITFQGSIRTPHQGVPQVLSYAVEDFDAFDAPRQEVTEIPITAISSGPNLVTQTHTLTFPTGTVFTFNPEFENGGGTLTLVLTNTITNPNGANVATQNHTIQIDGWALPGLSAGDVDGAAMATAVAAYINGNHAPDFADFTAVANANAVTLTSDVPGQRDMTATLTTNVGQSVTITQASLAELNSDIAFTFTAADNPGSSNTNAPSRPRFSNTGNNITVSGQASGFRSNAPGGVAFNLPIWGAGYTDPTGTGTIRRGPTTGGNQFTFVGGGRGARFNRGGTGSGSITLPDNRNVYFIVTAAGGGPADTAHTGRRGGGGGNAGSWSMGIWRGMAGDVISMSCGGGAPSDPQAGPGAQGNIRGGNSTISFQRGGTTTTVSMPGGRPAPHNSGQPGRQEVSTVSGPTTNFQTLVLGVGETVGFSANRGNFPNGGRGVFSALGAQDRNHHRSTASWGGHQQGGWGSALRGATYLGNGVGPPGGGFMWTDAPATEVTVTNNRTEMSQPYREDLRQFMVTTGGVTMNFGDLNGVDRGGVQSATRTFNSTATAANTTYSATINNSDLTPFQPFTATGDVANIASLNISATVADGMVTFTNNDRAPVMIGSTMVTQSGTHTIPLNDDGTWTLPAGMRMAVLANPTTAPTITATAVQGNGVYGVTADDSPPLAIRISNPDGATAFTATADFPRDTTLTNLEAGLDHVISQLRMETELSGVRPTVGATQPTGAQYFVDRDGTTLRLTHVNLGDQPDSEDLVVTVITRIDTQDYTMGRFGGTITLGNMINHGIDGETQEIPQVRLTHPSDDVADVNVSYFGRVDRTIVTSGLAASIADNPEFTAYNAAQHPNLEPTPEFTARVQGAAPHDEDHDNGVFTRTIVQDNMGRIAQALPTDAFALTQRAIPPVTEAAGFMLFLPISQHSLANFMLPIDIPTMADTMGQDDIANATEIATYISTNWSTLGDPRWTATNPMDGVLRLTSTDHLNYALFNDPVTNMNSVPADGNSATFGRVWETRDIDMSITDPMGSHYVAGDVFTAVMATVPTNGIARRYSQPTIIRVTYSDMTTELYGFGGGLNGMVDASFLPQPNDVYTAPMGDMADWLTRVDRDTIAATLANGMQAYGLGRINVDYNTRLNRILITPTQFSENALYVTNIEVLGQATVATTTDDTMLMAEVPDTIEMPMLMLNQEGNNEFDVDRPWSVNDLNPNREFPIFAIANRRIQAPDVNDRRNTIIAADLGYTFTGRHYVSYIERTQLGLTPEFDTEELADVALWADGGNVNPFSGMTDYATLRISVRGTNAPGEDPELTVPQTEGSQGAAANVKRILTFEVSNDYKIDSRVHGRFVNYRIDDDMVAPIPDPNDPTNFLEGMQPGDIGWNLSGLQFGVRKGGTR